jgi:M3 family oligoendopeptidase
MKFSEYPFIVPDIKKVESKFNLLLAEFKAAQSSLEQKKVIFKIFKIADEISTQFQVISVKYTIDTRVPQYQNGQDAIDEMKPLFQALYNKFQKALVSSRFRKELEKSLGAFLFLKTELSLKAFDDKIIEELQQENKLTSSYSKLLASAQIPFQKQILNLSQVSKFTEVLDRDVRKSASKAIEKWFTEKEPEIASIFDQLVKLRTNMAKKLGYQDFTGLAYARLGRTDYTPKDVQDYRQQVQKYIVPLSKKLIKKQAERTEISNPKFYDLNLSFKDGNPLPKGNKDYLVAAASKMYNQMGEEIGTFFQKMIDEELLDLDTKTGKQGGGYMCYFPKYQMPFIFSNFNGTSGDVDVLTHEVGHAFQGYKSRDIKIPEYRDPTMEEAEIHSMSMEFFAWPWMELFFKEDKDKYRLAHLESAINFLPYGVTVDEFQHFVYANPLATHEERCAQWRLIEKKYTPYKKYNGFSLYEKGGRWMRQHHIFSDPFYYIDYTLAQVVAFQFLNLMESDRTKAWQRYVKLCQLGGKYPFTELIKKAKLKNPFKNRTIASTIKPMIEILNRIEIKK